MLNHKQKGQSLVEYGLILALILVVCAGALGGLGQNTNTAIGAARDSFGGGGGGTNGGGAPGGSDPGGSDPGVINDPNPVQSLPGQQMQSGSPSSI